MLIHSSTTLFLYSFQGMYLTTLYNIISFLNKLVLIDWIVIIYVFWYTFFRKGTPTRCCRSWIMACSDVTAAEIVERQMRYSEDFQDDEKGILLVCKGY